MNLKADHIEELKRVQLQAANELREVHMASVLSLSCHMEYLIQFLTIYKYIQKTMKVRSEHEVQMKALQCQHEDEYRKLQEELHLQKSKVSTPICCYIKLHYPDHALN